MNGSLQREFNLTLRKYNLKPTDTVVVGVSTGVDSMVLLTLLEELPSQRRPKIVVAHVNHKLRAQSTQEQAFIEKYTQTHNLRVEIKVWSVNQHPKTGIENAARKIRYDFFAEVARKFQARFLFTAHQADDQAETFLMKLVRGGALQQLQGIDSRKLTQNTMVVRPLLPFSKEAIRQFATRKQLKWYEDQTNTDESFTRNRMRHQIVPRLKQENAQFLKHVQDYETQLQLLIRATEQREEQLTKELVFDDGYRTERFLELSTEWQNLTIQYISDHEVGEGKVSKQQQEEILCLLGNLQKPTGKLQINAQMDFIKDYQKFGFFLTTELQKKPLIISDSMLILNQWHSIEGYGKVGVFETDYDAKKLDDLCQVMQLSENQLIFPLTVRSAKPHDKLGLKNTHQKSVRRALMDAKVPSWQRVGWPLLVDKNEQPLWLLGLRKSWLQTPFEGDVQKYFIIWKPNNLEELN
ncbi:tRNA lysidine(34) synthetase TilS [Pediococcus ethanolidurans]